MAGAFPVSTSIVSEAMTPQNVILTSTSQSLSTQVRERPGHRWLLELVTNPMSYATWRDFEGFVVSQRGTYDTFTITLKSRLLLGAGGGTPKVNGASQTGRSVITDGWPNSTAILKRGDLIKFSGHNKVYMVTADVSSNGSGQATLSIEPNLFESPADNADVTLSTASASVAFTVAFTGNTKFDADVARMCGLNLSLIERP